MREVIEMKPLPKWVGWVGALSAIAGAVAHGASTGDWGNAGATIFGALAALLAHSATGTGGVQ